MMYIPCLYKESYLVRFENVLRLQTFDANGNITTYIGGAVYSDYKAGIIHCKIMSSPAMYIHVYVASPSILHSFILEPMNAHLMVLLQSCFQRYTF